MAFLAVYQYIKVPCSIVKYYPLLYALFSWLIAGHWFAYVLGPAKQRSSDILSPILTPVTKTSLNIVLSEPKFRSLAVIIPSCEIIVYQIENILDQPAYSG